LGGEYWRRARGDPKGVGERGGRWSGGWVGGEERWGRKRRREREVWEVWGVWEVRERWKGERSESERRMRKRIIFVVHKDHSRVFLRPIIPFTHVLTACRW
jgi:hypothetical protein